MYAFLKGCKQVYSGNEHRTRNFVSASIWMLSAGAQWRALPERFGKWNSIFARFNEWSEKGVWASLMEYCVKDPDLEWIVIDATIVRAHACAAGYKKDSAEQEGLGRSRGGFSTKIHARVDALGLPLQIVITPGNRNEITQVGALLENVKDSEVIADKAYDSDKHRAQLAAKNCKATIPSRANRIHQIPYDEHRYGDRHVVECFFGKMKQFRRIFSRFDKAARNFAAFLALAGASLWLR